MEIQTHLNTNSRNNDFGLPLIGAGSDYSLMKNCCDGGFDELCIGLQQKSQLFHQRNLNQLQSLSDEQFQYQSLIAQKEMQEKEIDQFMRSQSDKLRFLLQKQRKEQTQAVLKLIESKASALILQKDQEILKASRKKLELEALLQKTEMENQRWQKLAKEKESMVMAVKNMIIQARERVGQAAMVEDEGSCCGGDGGGGGEGCLDGEKIEGKCEKMVCRSCGTGNSSVVFLPCRHMCSCRDCEAYLDSCPVCSSPKKAAIEALIF